MASCRGRAPLDPGHHAHCRSPESLFLAFEREFREHASRACRSARGLLLPKVVDWDEKAGRFS